MGKIIRLLIIALFFSSSINSQSTEKFIRIIGNSKKEIKADKAKIYFSINELKAKTYQNTEGKDYEIVYNEVLSKFEQFGINSSNIKTSFKNINSYSKIKSKNFFIEVDLKDLEKIMNITLNGFKITDTKYIYRGQ